MALKNFVANLNTEQLVKINLWNSLILTTTAVSYFLILLYIPALFLKNKNPFVAYLISLKDLFSKKIFKTLAIFLLILMLSFFLSLLSTNQHNSYQILLNSSAGVHLLQCIQYPQGVRENFLMHTCLFYYL